MTERLSDAGIQQLLAERRAARLHQSWTSYPSRNPIASDFPDCERYQVVRLLAWRVRPVPEQAGLEVIENGRVQEPAMIRQLQDEGWEVEGLQETVEVRQPIPKWTAGPASAQSEMADGRRLLITGKIDGVLRDPALGREGLDFDTKDTGAFNLDRIQSEHDLRRNVWTRKWWRQAQIYMTARGKDRFALILGHRGRRRTVLLHLDYDEAEWILATAAWAVAVHEAAIADDLTDEAAIDGWLRDHQVPYHQDYSACERCPFRDRVCHPPVPEPELTVLRPDLEPLVDRFITVNGLAGEARRIREELIGETRGAPAVAAGRFLLKGEATERPKANRDGQLEMSSSWTFKVLENGEPARAEARQLPPAPEGREPSLEPAKHRTLGIVLAGECGWAIEENGCAHLDGSGMTRLAWEREAFARRYERLQRLLTKLAPTQVIFYQPSFGGRPGSSAAIAFGGYQAIVLDWCREHQAEYGSLTSREIRKGCDSPATKAADFATWQAQRYEVASLHSARAMALGIAEANMASRFRR